MFDLELNFEVDKLTSFTVRLPVGYLKFITATLLLSFV